MIPYWIIVLAVLINIISIVINKQGNINSMFLSALSTRIYFLIIYISFWMFDTSIETRAIWSRWGILAIFVSDSTILLIFYYRRNKERINLLLSKLISNLKTRWEYIYDSIHN